MAKKRKRKSTGTSVVRRRVSVAKRKSPRKRRGLSEGGKQIPFIGAISLKNPLIGGAVGGWGASLIKDEISDTFFGKPKDPADENEFANKIAPFTKGIVIAGIALLAKKQGYNEIAAGMVGAAAAMTRQKLQETGKLKEGGSMRKRKLTTFADPNLLSEAEMLSERTYVQHRRGRR